MSGWTKLTLVFLLVLLVVSSISTVWAGTPASPRPQQNPPRPVVFIHGYCGQGDDWARPESILGRLRDDYGYDPANLHIFYYPDGPGQENNRGDIAQIAWGLAQYLEGFPGQVDIVAHSMGAVITRYYMAHYMDWRNPKVVNFISIGGANNGSWWAAVKGGLLLGESSAPDLPKQILAFEIMQACESVPECCLFNPADTAVRQLIPAPFGPFMSDLNQPQYSPPDVNYAMIYGNIVGVLRIREGLFGWTQEISLEGLGDTVIGVESATTIPGIGKRGEVKPNYRSYEIRSEQVLEVTLKAKCDLGWWHLPYCYTGIAFDTQLFNRGQPYPFKEAKHDGLFKSEAVAAIVDSILRQSVSPTPTPTPVVYPPPYAGGRTATVLIMDVSGSMGDDWQGGVKLDSAVDAAGRIVRRVQHENEVSGANHRMALVGFSTQAWVDVPMGFDLDAILAALNAYTPLERTNIGHALQLANAELASVSDEEMPIIILLTDGMTNEGLSPEEILAGPVAEAVQAGACIYTVGFGDPGELDEAFLREIAAAAPCGGYYYAFDADQLIQVYARLRHISTGTLVAEHSGTIAQGEQQDLGEIEVPAGQGELHVSLDWLGSQLDLLLTDPQGKLVDEHYPGASIFREAASLYALIRDPAAGRWRVGVYGREVPQGTATYYLAASTRQATSKPTGGGSGFIAFLAGLLISAVLLVLVNARRPAAVRPAAALYIDSGPAGQIVFPLGEGTYNLGREADNHLLLLDPQASHHHAQVACYGGAFFLLDLQSANGTYVNQVRLPPLQWHHLQDGDQIRIGNTFLVFRKQN